jgi:hypothetical protein
MRPRLPFARSRGPQADAWTDGTSPEETPDGASEVLERVAAGPLSPDDEALARMKNRLLAAYAQPMASRVETGRPSRSGYRRRLFAATASIAVMLMAAGGVAAAESGPGEPFYRVRLDVEALFLPAPGSDARLTADLDRAQARLAEAQRAASSGDWNAEADALGAYSDVVGSISLTGTQANREAAQARLRGQLEGLLQLRSGAGGNAPAGVTRAIDDVDELLGGPPETPGPRPSPATQPSPAHGETPSPAHGETTSPAHGPSQGPASSSQDGGPKGSASPTGQGGDSGGGNPAPSPSSRPSGAGPDSSAGNGQGGKPSDQGRGG